MISVYFVRIRFDDIYQKIVGVNKIQPLIFVLFYNKSSSTLIELEDLFYPLGVPSDADSSASSNKINGINNSKSNRPSLAKILLSLDGNLAKQQSLSHILTALQIMYAR